MSIADTLAPKRAATRASPPGGPRDFQRDRARPGTLARCIWNALRGDLFLGLPFVPLYSLAEVAIGFAAGSLLQLIYVETPRVPVASLIPEGLRGVLHFGQTLDRKDLAFTVPLVIVLAGLIKLVAGFLSSYLIERAGHRAAHAMRSELLRGFLSARGNTLDGLHVDDLANRVLLDTTLLQNAVSKGTVSVLRDGCVIVFIAVGMFVMAFKIMAIALVALVPLIWVLRRISQALTHYAQESAARQVAISTRALQSWNGRLTVHALRAQGRERSTLAGMADSFYAFIRKSFLVRTTFRPGTEMLAILLLAGMLQWKFEAPAALNPATVTTLLILGVAAFRPLKQISGVVALATDVRAVYSRLSVLWDTLFTSAEGAGAAGVAGSVGAAPGDGVSRALSARSDTAGTAGRWPAPSRGLALEVDDLTVRLADGRELLSGCSLRVPFGSRVALVGESGAGKTTFLRTVAGLLEPAGGTVRVAQRALLATQQPYVFKGTLQGNVLYRSPDEGEPTPPEEDRLRSLLLKLRLAHSPLGTQVVADKGVGFLGEGLSGGEKARVALARLLFVSPRVLLLDEPTANLDALSAAAFWVAVDDWQAKDPENTVIAVSHALHEVAGFDRVCVFQGGRIVREESGAGAPQ